MTHRNPILYFAFQDILGAASVLSNKARLSIIDTWALDCHKKPMHIGGLEVGQVIDVRVDTVSERVGLVIEWNERIQIATLL